jgi:glycogen phosphorylase
LIQYALLGIGGIRLLRSLGIDPSVVHLNEGHAALAAFELALQRIEQGVPFEEAMAEARGRTVFTTHTPVAAGNEMYPAEAIWQVLGDLPEKLQADQKDVLGLGRSRPEDPDEPFGLTVFGIRSSRETNAVSRLHGQVARLMWHHLFPGRPLDDVPIAHVTNGVHLPTWMAPPMQTLLDRHLGEGWQLRAADPATWEPVDDIPDEAVWAVRSQLRAELVAYVRDRCVADRLARGEPLEFAEAGGEAFDAEYLTLGFARRVAAYKRLNLLIHDRDRAARLLFEPHPIQLVVAGKAHPADTEAKHVLQSVFSANLPATAQQRVVFLEDYELGMAAKLVGGCDVWVNLPRPPLEASGTSGMKSALNGGLNLSVLDGWWAEAFDGSNGWGISGDPSRDPAEQDRHDAAALYDMLANEVGPLFYDRGEDGIPRGWVRRIKASLRSVGPRFCASRILDEYVSSIYRL